MSTAGTARMKHTHEEGPVKVMIQVDPEMKTISVSPDPFYVSKERGEVVEWDIKPAGYCFTVHFVDGSPFEETTFGHNHPRSGRPSADAEPHPKLYKYTVAVPTIGALDPYGGVTP